MHSFDSDVREVAFQVVGVLDVYFSGGVVIFIVYHSE